MKKNLITANWMQSVIKITVCLSVLVASNLFTGCTDPKPDDLIDTTLPYSVAISDKNINMPTGGTITSQYSDHPKDSDISKLVDSNSETFFSTDFTEFYILWAGSDSVLINNYTLTSADSPEKDPKSWTLSGSNDNEEWTILDTQEDQIFSNRKEIKEYLFDNEATFKYYKLAIKANNGSSSTQIAEWTMQLVSTIFTETVGADNVNMLTAGTITSQYSDFSKGSEPGKLLDNDVNTMYVTKHRKFYLLWEGDKAVLVNNYTLTSSGDVSEKDPRAWTLSGSNDNAEWTVLDTQVDQIFSKRQETLEYQIPNSTEYKYYKLDIEGNNGDMSTQISEWTMRVILPYSVNIEDGNVNVPSGGILTSQYSDSPSGSEVNKLMDGLLGSKFVTYHDSFYLLWKSNLNVAINYYVMTSSLDSPANDPKSWTLYASNDSVDWKLLDTQTDQTFSKRKEEKRYFYDNKVRYKYYRMNVLSNHGGVATQFAEWVMEAVPANVNALTSRYGSGSTKSSTTPMGTHYQNRRKTTDGDREWLKDPSNEPPISAASVDEGEGWYLKEFPVTLYPYGKPMPADINQHAIGDCGGVAALASLAYIYPDFVKTLIKDNGDNTYTVSMFDPQGKPVEVVVTNKFLTKGAGDSIDAVSGKNNTANWGTILEKAVMKYNVIYKANPGIGGIGAEHLTPVFTGNGESIAFERGKMTNADLALVVRVSLMQGKIVIGGFGGNGDVPIGNSKSVGMHAYTFMHSTVKNTLFAMRNPWGGNPDVDGKLDGVLYIPDNDVVAPVIDLRIINPGIANTTGVGIIEPYVIPTLTASQSKMRVSEELMRMGN